MKRADTMFAYVALNPRTDEESIIAGHAEPIGRMIACSHDLEHLNMFGRAIARSYAAQHQRPVRLVEYHVARELEVIEPPRPPTRQELIERLPDVCPVCKHPCGTEIQMIANELRAPRAGDHMLCVNCAAYLLLGPDRAVRELTAEEFDALPDEAQALFSRIRNEILEQRKHRRTH